jgi:putative transposase
MLRHHLAVAGRERPKARARLTWPDRAWLALLAGTVPAGSLARMRLVVTAGTILRWHRGIVGRQWGACRGVAGPVGRPRTARCGR